MRPRQFDDNVDDGLLSTVNKESQTTMEQPTEREFQKYVPALDCEIPDTT